MNQRPASTVLISSIVAALLGLGSVFGIGLSPVCILGTVLLPMLWAWGGMLPAAAYTACMCISTYWLYSLPGTLLMLLLCFVPSAVIVLLSVKRMDYFRRMLIAMAVQAAVILLPAVYLYFSLGRSLIDVLEDALAGYVSSLHPYVGEMMLQAFAAGGMFDAATAETIFAGGLTAEQISSALTEVLGLLLSTLRLSLPALIVSTSMISGTVGTVFCGKLCNKLDNDESYVHIGDWYVSPSVTGGVVICLVMALILQLANVNGAEPVMNTVTTAASLICMMAGVCSVSRAFKRAGRGATFRRIFIVLAAAFASTLLMIVGACSALLGSHGVITRFMKNRTNNNNNNDMNE